MGVKLNTVAYRLNIYQISVERHTLPTYLPIYQKKSFQNSDVPNTRKYEKKRYMYNGSYFTDIFAHAVKM